MLFWAWEWNLYSEYKLYEDWGQNSYAIHVANICCVHVPDMCVLYMLFVGWGMLRWLYSVDNIYRWLYSVSSLRCRSRGEAAPVSRQSESEPRSVNTHTVHSRAVNWNIRKGSQFEEKSLLGQGPSPCWMCLLVLSQQRIYYPWSRHKIGMLVHKDHNRWMDLMVFAIFSLFSAIST